MFDWAEDCCPAPHKSKAENGNHHDNIVADIKRAKKTLFTAQSVRQIVFFCGNVLSKSCISGQYDLNSFFFKKGDMLGGSFGTGDHNIDITERTDICQGNGIEFCMITKNDGLRGCFDD